MDDNQDNWILSWFKGLDKKTKRIEILLLLNFSLTLGIVLDLDKNDAAISLFVLMLAFVMLRALYRWWDNWITMRRVNNLLNVIARGSGE